MKATRDVKGLLENGAHSRSSCHASATTNCHFSLHNCRSLGRVAGAARPRPAGAVAGRAVLTRGDDCAALCSSTKTPTSAFGRRAELESGFVMAYWGEAMTYHQTLWRNERRRRRDGRRWPASGRRPRRDAPVRATRESRVFSPPSSRSSARATPTRAGASYADDMGRLHARYPDDPDVAVLLRAGAARHDVAQPDRHCRRARGPQPGARRQRDPDARRRDSRPACCARTRNTRARCTTCCTTTTIRSTRTLALDAARTLARLAPDSSHARHMPAHIFLQLGTWHDAAAVGPRRLRRVRCLDRPQGSWTRRCATTTRSRGCSTSCCSSGGIARRGRRSTRSRRSSRRRGDARRSSAICRRCARAT